MPIFAKKRRILKLLISIGYFALHYIGYLIRWLLGRDSYSTCTILYYHSIPDCQKDAFAHQMDITKSLTIPISIERIPELLPGKHYSSITFDDGFEDVIINALPETEKRLIPSAIFLTAGYLGQLAEWWPALTAERKKIIADAEKWQAITSKLVTIGSHSLTHPSLSMLSEKEARRELCESRARLKKLLRRDINAFSFPYGDFNENLISWCREAGYKRIFTSMPGNAFLNENEFISGRVAVEPTDWSLEFRLKLLGAYRWLPLAISWKRKILLHFVSIGFGHRRYDALV